VTATAVDWQTEEFERHRPRHRVAYVTQAPSIYADLTVAENLPYLRARRRTTSAGGFGSTS
jgi:ABC-type multidrug transport system ATPase subunit